MGLRYNIEAERLFAYSTNRGILLYPLKMDFAERNSLIFYKTFACFLAES